MIDPISSSAASLGAGIARDPGRPANIQEAAQKFEALLVAQMLRGAREESAEDLGAGASLMEMAEGVFAELIASGGGLGLARMVVEQVAPATPAKENPGAHPPNGKLTRR